MLLFYLHTINPVNGKMRFSGSAIVLLYDNIILLQIITLFSLIPFINTIRQSSVLALPNQRASGEIPIHMAARYDPHKINRGIGITIIVIIDK